jgi:Tripartite tricarboxylate transporter family receptor
MSVDLLKSLAGIDLQHIPYRATAPAMTDVISGQISAMFSERAHRQAADGVKRRIRYFLAIVYDTARLYAYAFRDSAPWPTKIYGTGSATSKMPGN